MFRSSIFNCRSYQNIRHKKSKMETEHEGFQKGSSFSRGLFSGSMLDFGGVSNLHLICYIQIYMTRWWFQMCCIFTSTWGNDPIWLIFCKWVEATTYMNIPKHMWIWTNKWFIETNCILLLSKSMSPNMAPRESYSPQKMSIVNASSFDIVWYSLLLSKGGGFNGPGLCLPPSSWTWSKIRQFFAHVFQAGWIHQLVTSFGISLGKPMVNKPLLRPYFWEGGGTLGGVG